MPSGRRLCLFTCSLLACDLQDAVLQTARGGPSKGDPAGAVEAAGRVDFVGRADVVSVDDVRRVDVVGGLTLTKGSML